MASLNELFERFEVVCKTSGTYLALIRPGKEKAVLTALNEKAKIKLKLGSALVKYDYSGNSLTYVAPNRVIIKLRDSGSLSDAKALMAEIVG